MKKKRKNKQDATLRNIRAQKKREATLWKEIEKLKERVGYLMLCVENIEDSLVQIDLQFERLRKK